MKASHDNSSKKVAKSRSKVGKAYLVVKIWGVEYKIFHGSRVEVPYKGPLIILNSGTWFPGRVISIRFISKMILVRYHRRWLFGRCDRVDVEVAEGWFELDDLKGAIDGPFPY